MNRIIIWCCIVFFAILVACNDQNTTFKLLDPEDTGIVFTNNVIGEDSVDIYNNYFYYNGAGVAVADFNNDSLPDIFFAGNHEASALYLNKGPLAFKEVTEEAGLKSGFFSTGATFADVNSDGWLDIFVCTVGKGEHNLFYINQGVDENGIPHFIESAEALGITTKSVSVHAGFVDYDKDNDLDLLIAINSQKMNYRNELNPREVSDEEKIHDILYRNDGDKGFTDVSTTAGITIEGSSLGLAINDMNMDGWPDFYISNDFISNDLIYINNQDGTFSEKGRSFIRHGTFHGMGIDIADIDQNGWMDITVLDMLPPTNSRQKLMITPINYNMYQQRAAYGYMYQYVRNTLQLNSGTDNNGNLMLSEVGALAGMHATDWSWAPLWADFDLNGKLDLFISNGYSRDVTDLDYISGLNDLSSFGTRESFAAAKLKAQHEVREIKVPNYLFMNNGEFPLENFSEQAGFIQPSISHGAAFADLDKDGDLDLIVNNLYQPAFIYQNMTFENPSEPVGHYLKVNLKGPNGNVDGLGTLMKIYYDGQQQSYYHSVVRGYMSSMNDEIYIGLGASEKIDSVAIIWSDGSQQLIYDLIVDQSNLISHTNTKSRTPISSNTATVFKEVSDSIGLKYNHLEDNHNDFSFDPLLQKMYSREGPGVAVGDIDNDGFEDVIIGGSRNNHAMVFRNDEFGFSTSKQLHSDSVFEDLGMLLFDCDSDGDLDLYCVSGGVNRPRQQNLFQDRLYINNGKGNFNYEATRLPEINASGSVVVGNDYDKDGDIDLFVGGRLQPGSYPSPAESYLLRNDNGKFSDIAPESLKYTGLVSGALWSDFDDDGWQDLIVVGEWMEICFFKNNEGKLEQIVTGTKATRGWWNSIAAGDFDNDGDTDYLVGNFGENSFIQASLDKPVRLYYGDFDNNKKLDPILSNYVLNDQGELQEFPVAPRDALLAQIFTLKKQFNTYSDYAQAGISDIIKSEKLSVDTVAANNLSSILLENIGNGEFVSHRLPWECQVAPIYGISVLDFNGDGNLDIITSGNLHPTEPIFGRYDASNGLLLKGNGQFDFEVVPINLSGVYLKNDQRSMVKLDFDNSPLIISSANSGPLSALHAEGVSYEKVYHAKPDDQYAIIIFEDGRQQKKEFYWGEGYLSQSSRMLSLSSNMKTVTIYTNNGQSKQIK